ncbi:hypothetical protein [Fructilactobacillus fructivorans]|uniref:Uncharacterized protein n=1 Tax=Fructilactobacillus fructivorans TaxID=1614 RepID=A0A0C1Q360_9LACO|nr:hypothetical protein [Fructilactobacillus fructivorans]KID42258.1 hypothetical protein LfDm3_0187 [Fructilactobacillus fructivorans]MCT0151118.1 hypothetical protein [Fructilactobacillus fructivorans]MCT2867324.1 hypothetical protein [Fructilactobacillus fructivorans]MCT2869156.1 hypothetical protein [Fructilactobacillus fructivorans]MCT2873123.1 hypothetical protein [Fructilactobacillus fructivorans]
MITRDSWNKQKEEMKRQEEQNKVKEHDSKVDNILAWVFAIITIIFGNAQSVAILLASTFFGENHKSN